MNPHLNIVYITNRKEPKIEWFFDSLERQLSNRGNVSIKVVVVDYYASKRLAESSNGIAGFLHNQVRLDALGIRLDWVNPKPSVYNGSHRLTSKDYFDAAGSRNTGLLYCEDGWVLYMDDLSVMKPGYMDFVFSAVKHNAQLIYLGAYHKVLDLKVVNGSIISFTPMEDNKGRDSRWSTGDDNKPVSCDGNVLFGCSLLAPVEAFLAVGGWAENLCSSLGFEDVIVGTVLQNIGWKFVYVRQMTTYESEELHYLDEPFTKRNPKIGNDDKAWTILRMAQGGLREFSMFYAGGIRKMRQEVLAGGSPPILNDPQHDWYTGTPLKDL